MKIIVLVLLFSILRCSNIYGQNPYPALSIDNFMNSAYSNAREIEAQRMSSEFYLNISSQMIL